MVGRLLTSAQVSERTGYAVQTLARWRCEGEGPPYIGKGPGIRYPESGLEAWIDGQLEAWIKAHSRTRKTARR